MRFDLRRSINPVEGREANGRANHPLLLATAVLWGVALFSSSVLRIAYDPPPAFVHVRWAPAVDDAGRERLEQQYSLTRPSAQEARTWHYYLADLSRANVRALVQNPAVEDTHYINRERFSVWRTAPRSAYTGFAAPVLPSLLRWVYLATLALGAVALVMFLAGRYVPGAQRLTTLTADWPVAWIRRSIPEVSAEGVAAFRVVLGLCLLGFFIGHRVDGRWLLPNNATRLDGVVGPAIDLLARAPAVVDGIHPWLMFWTVLFVLGAAARLSFVLLVAGALAWSVVYASNAAAHPMAVLPVALVALLWSRWSDAWSVDARLRRVTPVAGRSRLYGYTVWVPGFVLGVTLAAAAVAKLRESGLAWILNGTVKYHFLSDAADAPVDWGLRIGSHPTLAVLLSLAAIVVELLVIAGACSRHYSRRLAAGVAAAGLLGGFWLFQGLVWPAWWILLLSFLPWHLVAPTASPVVENGPRRRLLQQTQVAMTLLLVGQQIIASASALELEPLMSTYDMYSTTYDSPEDYEAKSGMGYWLIARFEDGRTDTCQFDRSDFDRFSSMEPDDPAVRPLLERCLGSAAPVRSILIEGRRRTIDWTTWRIKEDTRLPLVGPITLKSAS
jgi:hypothetical protein